MATFLCVPQNTVTIIEQCGKFRKAAQPGCTCLCCIAGEFVAGRLSLRVQQLQVELNTKTKDNVFVTLRISIQYQVVREAIYDAFYRLTNAQEQIKSYVYDIVRAKVPKLLLDEVFEAKDDIAMAVKGELTKIMSTYGYEILQTLVTDIDPDKQVRAAMNRINAAQREKLAAFEEGEGGKIRVVKAAEAEAERKYLEGQGIARQRQAIVNGLRESILDFKEGIHEVNSREVVDMMMMTQYFDMLRELGNTGKSNTIFTNSSPAGMKDIQAQIRQGMLEAGSMSNNQQANDSHYNHPPEQSNPNV